MGGDVPNKAATVLRASDIDLSSSAGVQEVLRLVRGTPMVREDYNKVRDLIFEYKKTGGNKDVEEKIFSILKEVGLMSSESVGAAPDPQKDNPSSAEKVSVDAQQETSNKETKTAEVSKQTPRSRFGNTRPQPSFGKSSKADVGTKPETNSKPASEPTKLKVSSAEDSKEIESPKPETANSIEEVKPEEKQPEPEVSEKPSEEKPEAEEKTNTESGSATNYGNPLERIREIKQEVNLKVGNPINLIDADNEVGREYMNALLAAMKTLNSGSSGEVNLAMQRLEAAFADVQKTISEKSLTPETDSKKENVQPVEPAAKTEVPELDKTNEPATLSKQQVGMVENESSDSDEVVSGYMSRETKGEEISDTRATDDISSPFIPKEKPTKAESEEVKSDDTAISKFEPVRSSGAPLPKDKLYDKEEVSEDKEEPVTKTNKNDGNKVVASKTSPLQSVAKEKQLENIMHSNLRKEAEQNKAAREAEIASMDPLMVPDVTNGLKQLLSEWSLFKSSGIFGTGPNGIDHPLYKKLADLQMTAIVSGRFEGANPEVRQSITDYMNGWRYEEGIIHNHGETFEHYLRRVIKHILDEQERDNSSQ